MEMTATKTLGVLRDINSHLGEIAVLGRQLSTSDAPSYVRDAGHYFYVKTGQLRYTLERVTKKVPKRFAGEQ